MSINLTIQVREELVSISKTTLMPFSGGYSVRRASVPAKNSFTSCPRRSGWLTGSHESFHTRARGATWPLPPGRHVAARSRNVSPPVPRVPGGGGGGQANPNRCLKYGSHGGKHHLPHQVLQSPAPPLSLVAFFSQAVAWHSGDRVARKIPRSGRTGGKRAYPSACACQAQIRSKGVELRFPSRHLGRPRSDHEQGARICSCTFRGVCVCVRARALASRFRNLLYGGRRRRRRCLSASPPPSFSPAID